ncbi:ribose-5-phosphate isomerase RpiA [soil metagenome]|jgi:ribose 5-phosphate isomerase A
MEDLKRAAAERAVEEYVESWMVVGLGTGSTVSHAVWKIGELIENGSLSGVRGVPTSARTATMAHEVGIPLVTLSEERPLFTIDGADEIGPGLNLIKGRGGALLREKIVADAGEFLVVVADDTKLVDTLGLGPLPVEIEPFGWEVTLEALASLGCEPSLRLEGQGSQTGDPERPYVTDGGHYTADCLFPSIPDPAALEEEIKRIPGALETGLFIGLTKSAVIARQDGTEVIQASTL